MQDIGFKILTIFQLRLKRLSQNSIADFNTKMSYINSLLYNPYEDKFNKAINNMPKDFQMLRLIIHFYFNILSEFFLLILILAGV